MTLNENAMTTKQRLSITALLGLVTAVAAVTLAILAVTGYRSSELHFVTALKNFEWATYTAAAALALSLAGVWLTRPRSHRRGLLPALSGVALALPLVVVMLNFEYAARAYPPINDISTDTEDPPTFWEVPNPVTYPGPQVAELQHQAYPDLKPLALAMDLDRAFVLAASVARDMGWEIVSENHADLQIEAVASSLLFGFKDNVAIRLQQENDHSRVDVRSHSRLGRIDRGVNARRIRAYLQALAQRSRAGSEMAITR